MVLNVFRSWLSFPWSVASSFLQFWVLAMSSGNQRQWKKKNVGAWTLTSTDFSVDTNEVMHGKPYNKFSDKYLPYTYSNSAVNKLIFVFFILACSIPSLVWALSSPFRRFILLIVMFELFYRPPFYVMGWVHLICCRY